MGPTNNDLHDNKYSPIQAPQPARLSPESPFGSSACSLRSETLGTAWITIGKASPQDDEKTMVETPASMVHLPSPWLRRLVRDRERMRWISATVGILILLLFISCIVFWVVSSIAPSARYTTHHAQGPSAHHWRNLTDIPGAA
ncbi:hypothetical protein BX666DRAFT_2026333 [Dichotomocladium elegans]|nr:hypothetical protein BX666DRAFT_2026333 [Dichotomocladium elegans]